MAITQVGLFDDIGLGGVRLAGREIHAVGALVGAVRVKVASASSTITSIIASAAEVLMADTPKGALMTAANAALAEQRMPVRRKIVQLTTLVKCADLASRERVLELARQVGIGPVGVFPRERSPLIEPTGDLHLRVGDALQTSAETELWRMLG